MLLGQTIANCLNKKKVHSETTISPEKFIFAYEGVVMYMRALGEPLLMGTNSPEVSFIGFGTGISHDEIASHDDDCESPSLLTIDPVNKTLPQKLMELDEERYPYYTLFFHSFIASEAHMNMLFICLF